MNAVEIEQAISDLVAEPFDAASFPFEFLRAFGVSEAAVAKLRAGKDNKSDVPGAVLQRSKNNIHLHACPAGTVDEAFAALRASPANAKFKPRFLLATDGQTVQAVRMDDDEPLACEFKHLPDRFAYFLSLAGISTVKRIDENAFDIRATGRLNKLYVELLRHNPDWDSDARRQDLNHFFARLIFCFFAEDTNIFVGGRLFTDTLEQMTARDGSNVHTVLAELFRAMNTKPEHREAADIRPWANVFPYVNGNLFGGDGVTHETPRFSASARNYLIFVGNLDWKRINPDIFGSMIQAVADDEERGALGMHYTSVPNILKVLNPLFLDELRQKLAEADRSPLKLLNLRKRLAHIRVFDPACGSGNFLVIAYKEMRQIEAEINARRGEPDRASEIPISNFRGIELRHFPTEIARLALVIAEYQCDVLYRGEQLARDKVLPLQSKNWITHGNALRLDWLTLFPSEGTGVKLASDDLYGTPKNQAEIDFENAGGETYICGNPPYYGSRRQQEDQKADLRALAADTIKKWKSLDYVCGWLLKAATYADWHPCRFAFVSTSSIAEGLQVSLIWPQVLGARRRIYFGQRPFKWSNLAKSNAGVSVVIVGVTARDDVIENRIFDGDSTLATDRINPYLAPAATVYVEPASASPGGLARMVMGSMPRDGGNLILSQAQADLLTQAHPTSSRWIRRYLGTDELVKGLVRYCLWIGDDEVPRARGVPSLEQRLSLVAEMRRSSPLESTIEYADRPHRFVYLAGESQSHTVAVGGVSSESREYLPVDLLPAKSVVSNLAFAMYDAPVWTVALVASRLHLAWIAAVCGRLETRYRYSSTLGWNTFPVPTLTDAHKAELTRRAEDILLAREAYFPATIAEMYDVERMDTEFPEVRAAHERNDETLERIYIGRRFRNDTERLEKLFALYTEMTARQAQATPAKRVRKKGA